jgi:predicted DNA-binding transcriptional regulator AlpA
MDALLRLNDVIRLVGMSKTDIYSRMKRHEFPSRVRLGRGRAVRWKNSDIQEFISTRPPVRDQ